MGHSRSNTMQFYILPKEKKLLPGAYGIPEPPADAPLIEADRHTLCLVPALPFSADGHRLGYGKGYYDRFLDNLREADIPVATVGLVFPACRAELLPRESHDIPVDYVLWA